MGPRIMNGGLLLDEVTPWTAWITLLFENFKM